MTGQLHVPAHVPAGEGARRLAAPFRVLVLLNDRLTLRLGELRAALREDFPGMAWPEASANDGTRFDTVDAPSALIDCGPTSPPAALRASGRPDLSWADLLARNRIAEDGPLAARLAAASTCIDVSVSSRGPALADRLEAARRATAVAAVFADLPIAAGAIELWSDRVLSPVQARDLANSVAEGEIPLLDWTLPLLFHHEERDRSEGLSSGTTVGLSAFLGYEMETRSNPEAAGLAIASLLTVSQEVVSGHIVPSDGLAFSPFDPEAAPHRLRFVPEGRLGNDTDRWCLIHPESPFDDVALVGPLPEADIPSRRPEGPIGLMRAALNTMAASRLRRGGKRGPRLRQATDWPEGAGAQRDKPGTSGRSGPQAKDRGPPALAPRVGAWS